MALFVAVIGLGPRLLNVDGDLGRHLTIGRYILQTLTIPTSDLFSHTMAGQPVTPHEWLAQVIYAVAYQSGGMNGVVFLCALLIALTFTLCFRQCYQRSGMVLVSLGFAILGAAAASLHWLARPHLFTLLLVVLWVGELEQIRKGSYSRWWLLAVLMIIWANLHGAFIAGFVILGFYILGGLFTYLLGSQEYKPRSTFILLLAGVTSLLASFINPSGLLLWSTSLGYIRNRYLVGHTAEYLSPDFHNLSTMPFLIMIAISILLFGFQAILEASASEKEGKTFRKTSIVAILLLASWTVMGLYSVRNIPIFVLIAAPILAEVSADILRHTPNFIQEKKDILDFPTSSTHPVVRNASVVSRISGSFYQLDSRLSTIESSLRGALWPIIVIILVGLAFAGGARLDFVQHGNTFDPAVFPVEAVNWLQGHPQKGEVFNYFPWGGYLLYREWPTTKVFIDGQTDFYGEALTRQYEQVLTLAEGWQDVLNQYHIEWVIMPSNSVLVKALSLDPAWCLVYQDNTAQILYYESSQ